MKGAPFALAVLCAAHAATAEGVVQPFVSPTDSGTDAYLAPYAVRISLDTDLASNDSKSAEVYTLQSSFGPFGEKHPSWSVRFRLTAVDGSDKDPHAGPFTMAIQRHVLLEPLNAAPLLAIHFGFEGAVSTPWLSDRELEAPAALRSIGLDSELAQDGWSFRSSAYGRIDFLGCRNEFLEAGGGPELFTPTTSAANLAAIRYHAGFGFEIFCSHRDVTQRHHLGLLFEYRARGIVYQGGASPSYDQVLSPGLQWVIGRVTVGASVEIDPCCISNHVIGIRLQTGLEGIRK